MPDPTRGEERARGDDLAALLEVNKKIGSVPPEALPDAIAEEAAHLLGLDNAGFRLLVGDDLVLGGRAGGARQTMLRDRLKVDESFSGRVVAEGCTLVSDLDQVPELVPEHRAAASRLGYATLLGVPLQMGPRTIGVLTFHGRRPFTQRDRELAEAFAGQAAVALEHARLYRASVQQTERLTALVDTTRLLSETLDFETVAARILATISSLLRTQYPVIFHLEPVSGDLLTVAVHEGIVPVLREHTRLPRGVGVVGLAVRERRTVVTPNVLEDPRITFTPEFRAAVERAPYRAVFGVPLIVGDRVIGAIGMGDVEGRVLQDEEIRLAEAFAAQAAIALENARLYTEGNRRRRIAEALAGVSRVLIQSLRPETVSERIVSSICGLLQARSSVLYRSDPSSGNLTPVATTGPGGAAVGGFVLPRGTGVAGLAVDGRRPAITANFLIDPRITLTAEERIRFAGLAERAALAVPLMIQDSVIGVLIVADVEGRAFSDEAVELAQAFADQAALALENARLYDQTQRAYQALAQTQAELVQSETLRAVGELAAGAAHHLNNLLAVVIGRIQMLLRGYDAPEVQRHLKLAERAAIDGAHVVTRLSRFSRHQSAATTVVPLDLNDLVVEVIEFTRPRWQDEQYAKGIRVEVELEPGVIPELAGDPPALREVLVNLILNAVDAMPNGGRVTIRTWATEADVYCCVSDTGTGMSAEVQRRAFEPFFTTKGVRSIGLGLSVNYGIIQRHGGELTLESTEGCGTALTVRLAIGSAVGPPERASDPEVPSHRLRILLIDDEEEVLSLIQEMLEEDGHEVVTAASGADGVTRVLNDRAFHLVLTDLGMPGMTGGDVARAVKAANPSLKVGIVTGWGEESLAPDVRASADFILGKPVTQDSLREALAVAQGSQVLAHTGAAPRR